MVNVHGIIGIITCKLVAAISLRLRNRILRISVTRACKEKECECLAHSLNG